MTFDSSLERGHAVRTYTQRISASTHARKTVGRTLLTSLTTSLLRFPFFSSILFSLLSLPFYRLSHLSTFSFFLHSASRTLTLSLF